MPLRAADILFKDRAVGTLIETASGGTRFSYAADWAEDIACCLSVTRREHEWAQGLHPFFQHLGPEGWLREQQARVAHVVEEDDLGLLLRYGADCIGAVSVKPPKGSEPPTAITEATASPGRTVSGIQKKLLVSRAGPKKPFQPAAADGIAPYIAKFNSERIATLVRNEALSLRWSAIVLGAREVNEFTLAFIPVIDEQALVLKRFDRGPNGEKLRLEDCAQILCKPRGQDYAGKYDAGYEDVAAIINRHSARPAIDLARFFRRLIVFALIGNCDAHLKNFSLLETSTGLRLSPAYDILNTAFYDGFDQTLALSINGRKVHLDTIDGDLFRDFGREIGLPDRAIEQIFADLRRQTKKAASVIRLPDAEGFDGFVTRYAEIVSNACLRILGA
ncbi:type II toxin-antitoxin system HipA family toxin [Microvirga puerhi]|uniref:HipA domain-containing protein n=1 Tax=Microvirga puerhi TaxID=2876078 RepID=A0ABS7VSD5_9HYPH|nr:HipA domain-containing protein [Microvirga puerhi]MBZ6078463.1 HipA domain-containing protein [Microvirga puerhi]